jgi:hypothetical protein
MKRGPRAEDLDQSFGASDFHHRVQRPSPSAI